MRLHTDVLTDADLYQALKRAGLDDVHIEMTHHRSQKREHAFEFRLAAEPKKGRRRRNTGHYGAEDAFQEMYVAAATYDEHGRWMAELFAMDPEAIIGYYDGRDDFNAQTDGKYQPASVA